MIQRPELFLIDDELYSACEDDWDEIDATFADMEELGIANLPYDNLDISLPCHLDEAQKAVSPGGYLEIYFCYRDGKLLSSEIRVPSYINDPSHLKQLPGETVKATLERLTQQRNRAKDIILPNDMQEGLVMWAEDAKRLLIVLLGSRDIVKERSKDKLAALGVGREKRKGLQRPLYSTRLSLPLNLRSTNNSGGIPGTNVRPHLRRGHIRRQRYGPQYKFIRKLWIEPCFINADREFVSARRSYNVGIRSIELDRGTPPPDHPTMPVGILPGPDGSE